MFYKFVAQILLETKALEETELMKRAAEEIMDEYAEVFEKLAQN